MADNQAHQRDTRGDGGISFFSGPEFMLIRRNSLALIAGLILVGVGLLVYLGTVQNQLVWDSIWYLQYHEKWVASLGLGNLHWMMLATEESNWHPLTWLSWALDYQIYGGLNPSGFHLTNNLLHAINSALVMLLAWRTYRLAISHADEKRDSLKCLVAAFCAGLLFAVHPQHVESVAWVAERKDVLCMLFTLLAMLAWISYATSGESLRQRYHGLSLLCFVLAAMAKPMAVTLPVVLLVLDFYPLQRTPWNQPESEEKNAISAKDLLREKAWFFLVSALLAVITLYAQQGAISSVPLSTRVINAFNSCLLYLQKLAWPTELSPFYPFSVDPNGAFLASDLLPVIPFAVVTVAVVYAWRRGKPYWLAAWAFYLVTLSPVIGIVSVGSQGAADRYAYFPTLPVYLLAGAGVLWVLRHWPRWLGNCAPIAVIVLAVILAGLTRAQVPVWHDPLSLWSSAYSQFPDNSRVNLQMGFAELVAGDTDSAVKYFERAVELGDHGDPLAWLAVTYIKLGRWRDSITAHVNLGQAADRDASLKIDQQCVIYNIAWNFAHLEMWPQANEMFLRLPKEGPLAQPAIQWIDWIKRISAEEPRDTGTISDISKLPSYCTAPLLNMRRTHNFDSRQ